MNSMDYPVPDQSVEIEYEVKKSRFIARLHYASTREEALHWLAKAREDFPDARHHCWAYLLGSPFSPKSLAMSDDGEPSGTAGKPILNVLQHKGVGEVMLVVIRYFGGIKLGAGGLVRAYSQAAQMAYDDLPTRVFVQREELTVVCDFADEQIIRHWLAQHAGVVTEATYHNGVSLRLELAVDQCDEFGIFVQGLKNASLTQH